MKIRVFCKQTLNIAPNLITCQRYPFCMLPRYFKMLIPTQIIALIGCEKGQGVPFAVLNVSLVQKIQGLVKRLHAVSGNLDMELIGD
jgi:hypothetical protein